MCYLLIKLHKRFRDSSKTNSIIATQRLSTGKTRVIPPCWHIQVKYECVHVKTNTKRSANTKICQTVQGSGHGIHFRQKYIIYRNTCLNLGKVRYEGIGGDVDDNWHPFGLQRVKRNQPSSSKKSNSADTQKHKR